MEQVYCVVISYFGALKGRRNVWMVRCISLRKLAE